MCIFGVVGRFCVGVVVVVGLGRVGIVRFVVICLVRFLLMLCRWFIVCLWMCVVFILDSLNISVEVRCVCFGVFRLWKNI